MTKEHLPWMCMDCRVDMIWQDGYQKCPECGVELWYRDGDNRPEKARKIGAVLGKKAGPEYLSRSYVPGTCEPGGSDPTGKTKKEKMNHPSVQQEYNRLFKQT